MKNLLLLIFLFVWANTLAQTPIDKIDTLTIGGIKQYITIKGKDNSKPLLLFLHGGPGGSVMNYAEKFTYKLQENFIVIQWDQRETGKTLQLNPSPAPLTLSLFQNDTHELIDSLLKRFHQPKLYLVGHSWGTVLGFYIAQTYPERLYAWIAISPMIHQLESERIILSMMKEKATQTGNYAETQELSKVKVPFENGEQLYFHRKWLFHFNGKPIKIFTKGYALTWTSRWLSVFNEASKINLIESFPEMQCPVYFFVGRKDYQTNYAIAETYYNKVTAPKKKLFWFDYARHSIPGKEPELMQRIIIEQIFTETY